jgi:serine/threonine protein kinase
MNTSDSSNACPKCGTTVPPDAPQGLCPQCVLGAAAAPEGRATATAQIPSLQRLSVAFPQLQVLELIGRGGMGFVFKARQPHLDRFVALKLLPDSLAQDPHFTERFNREGRTLARLNHPNIVSIFDFGQAGGFYFLLMEYVDGVNLRQAMQAGRFSTAEALTIVPKICEALQYAHEEGVLHRDIKPENILLDAKGRVKIADFGIAKIVGEEKPDISLTATGAALGTPHYMAPEQFEKPGTVDHRADIYSLGVVFYEMLTGELPIGRFALPSQKTPVDSRFDDVVLRTLEREREKRFQSAGEMKTNVEYLTGAAPANSLPPPPMANAGATRETIAVKPEDVLPETPTWSLKAIWGQPASNGRGADLGPVSLGQPSSCSTGWLERPAHAGWWTGFFACDCRNDSGLDGIERSSGTCGTAARPPARRFRRAGMAVDIFGLRGGHLSIFIPVSRSRPRQSGNPKPPAPLLVARWHDHVCNLVHLRNQSLGCGPSAFTAARNTKMGFPGTAAGWTGHGAVASCLCRQSRPAPVPASRSSAK